VTQLRQKMLEELQGRKSLLHSRATYWKHALSDFHELSRAEGPR
jgi:hypothetical protein